MWQCVFFLAAAHRDFQAAHTIKSFFKVVNERWKTKATSCVIQWIIVTCASHPVFLLFSVLKNILLLFQCMCIQCSVNCLNKSNWIAKKSDIFAKIADRVTLYFRDQFSPLNSCLLLACIILEYWLFISTNKAHINALFCIIIFWVPYSPTIPKLNNYLTINKQHIQSLLTVIVNSYLIVRICPQTKVWPLIENAHD